MYDYSQASEIRILPSSKDTFPTLDSFKHFIEKTMVNRGGYYYFPKSMMKCGDKTLVLFQYDGKVYAVGILTDAKKELVYNEKGERYAGYYRFMIPSLRFLDSPITKQDLNRIVPEFIGFNQTKQRISMNYFNEIINLVECKLSD